MDYMNELHELCETIMNEIADVNSQLRSANGKFTGGDYDIIDKLTHSLKSVKAVIAMMEDEEGYSGRNYMDGSSGMYYPGYPNIAYRGSNGNGVSYARGRNRDMRGRYSRGGYGYSRNGNMVDQLNQMIQDAPNDQMRMKLQQIVDEYGTQM
jgi:hypothetical protein